jgi:predicted GIY-YIG superfamily endonuclease
MESQNGIHLKFSNPTIKEIGEEVEKHKEQNVYNKKGIYTLECDKRPLGKTKAWGSNIGRSDKIPNWVWAAHNMETRYYVGSSKRVGYRILQHIYEDGAQFTKVFPPAHIMQIEWVEASTDNLRKMEKEKAEDLKDDETFVYQA